MSLHYITIPSEIALRRSAYYSLVGQQVLHGLNLLEMVRHVRRQNEFNDQRTKFSVNRRRRK